MPKKVALLIGVSECGPYIPAHLEAANNVLALQRVLQDPKLGGFDEVEALLNPDLKTMQKAIGKGFVKCGADDLALLFFSGHCLLDEEGHLYFTSNITGKDDFKTTAIPASFVQQQLSISDAEQQIVVLDCCFQSPLSENLPTANVGVNLNRELGAKGRIILTASSVTQTGVGQEGASLSPYTQYFAEGIETGAVAQEETGLIYVRDLHNYAKEKAQSIQPQKEPDIILEEKDFDILLTVLPSRISSSEAGTEHGQVEAEYCKIVENYGRTGEIPYIVNYTLEKKEKTLGIAVDPDTPDELISERSIDYTKLRDLLKTGQWQEADHETLLLILKAANREQEEYLNIESIESFPCADLHTIDRLWLKYSNGQFGFSLQKEIWRSVGGELGQYDNAVYEQFGLRVGWRDRNGMKLMRGWKKYEELSFSLTWGPVGHLPTLASGSQMKFEQLNFWGIRSDFFARIEACWL